MLAPASFNCLRFKCRLFEARCVAFQQDQREMCTNCVQGAEIAQRHGIKVTVIVRPRCRGPECTNPPARGGLCEGHRKQMRVHGELTVLRGYKRRKVEDDAPKRCVGPDCGRPVADRGLCTGHLTQLRRGQALHPLRKYRRTMPGKETDE